MNFKSLFLSLVVLTLLVSLASATTRVYAPAVDSGGKGVLTPIYVTAAAGTGRIRTDIQTSLIAPETEDSIRIAAQAAAKEADVNLDAVDINVDIESEAQLIDGPSGGMAFATAIYNELIHLTNTSAPLMRSDLVITGAITLDGRAEKVGGVEEKVIAAEENNITLMLIAAGQSANDGIDYTVFGREISQNQLQVVEVQSLHEALIYIYSASGTRVASAEYVIRPLVLQQFDASSKTLHVKRIAEEEIQNARAELVTAQEKIAASQDGEQARAILRSVNESLKNAEEAIHKGYYYTGANAAFLARINLETVNAEGMTAVDFQTKLNQLESEIKVFNISVELNDANYEQVAASQLRYWWALTRLKETKEEFSNSKTVSVGSTRDYYNSQAWFQAAEKLMRYAKEIQGNPVNEYNLREYAFDLLEQSEKIANSTSDSEMQWHLKTAKNAISGGSYAAAAFDLQFVLSADNAASEITGKTPEEIANEAKKIASVNVYSEKSTWAELYYANALYNLQDANRSSDISGVVTAIRLRQLASFFQESHDVTAREFTNPRQAKNRTIAPLNTLPLEEPTVSTTITATAGTSVGLLQIIAIIIMTLGLVILVSVAVSKMKKTTNYTPSAEEMLDKLDHALVSGRISEETYKRLRLKYKTRAKNEKTLSAHERIERRKR